MCWKFSRSMFWASECCHVCAEVLILLEQHYGIKHTLSSIPEDEKAVYNMLSRADSIGVFQVESRAQMSMLPRLRPEKFYDLVIEVAIVRPGPIQGDMVHPYLRRKEGFEKIEFLLPVLSSAPRTNWKKVLGRTLGRPPVSGAGHADRDGRRRIYVRSRPSKLRRSMATFQAHRRGQAFQESFHRWHVRSRLSEKIRGKLLQADRGVRRIWVPRKPRRELRASGLRFGLDQMPLSRCVSNGAAQQPADGFLRDRPAGA